MADHLPARTGRRRSTGPLGAAALFAAAVLGVGIVWSDNAGNSDVAEQPPVEGVGKAWHGMDALDVYVVPATSTSADGGSAGSWELAGALLVTAGPNDQLLGVQVSGAPSSLIRADGTLGAIAVTDSAPTDIGFTTTDPHVTFEDPAVRAGLDVPVTLSFAHRGDVHLSVPVLTALTGPQASDVATGGA